VRLGQEWRRGTLAHPGEPLAITASPFPQFHPGERCFGDRLRTMLMALPAFSNANVGLKPCSRSLRRITVTGLTIVERGARPHLCRQLLALLLILTGGPGLMANHHLPQGFVQRNGIASSPPTGAGPSMNSALGGMGSTFPRS